jgi:hypothetical protein
VIGHAGARGDQPPEYIDAFVQRVACRSPNYNGRCR